jgi:hypothetical protein
MAEPADPDSADRQRRWTIEAGNATLQPVSPGIAQAVLDGGPITSRFAEGALHKRIGQGMNAAIRHIDSGAAAVAPTVWLVVGPDERMGFHLVGSPPNTDEVRYALSLR